MYVTKEQVEKARSVDMVDFVSRQENTEIKRSGAQYRCLVHDSLVIMQDRKGWYWNSRGVGGNNAIAFMMKIYGYSFTDAVTTLCGDAPSIQNSVTAKPVHKTLPDRLILPEQDHSENGQRNYRNIIAYLCKSRGIDINIVNQLIYDNRIYQGIGYSNLTLLGYDKDNIPFYRYRGIKPDFVDYYVTDLTPQKHGKGTSYAAEGFPATEIPVLMQKDSNIKKYVNLICVNGNGKMIDYAFCHSIMTGSKYKIDLPASSKTHSFDLGAGQSKLYIFEAIIDMLSYATIINREVGNPDAWTGLQMLSLAGKTDKALEQYLINHPKISELVLCLDNDEAGITASKELAEKYKAKGYTVTIKLPNAKDYNDLLLQNGTKGRTI